MNSVSLGDLAQMTADSLQRGHLSDIADSKIAVDQAGPFIKEGTSMFSKVRFSWRTEDRLVLEQIKGAAQAVFDEQFSSAILLLDDFISKVRGPDGRENWDRLTGDEIESMLFSLAEIRFTVMPQVNELLLEAMYAKNIADDAYSKVWGEVIDGTQGDKSAKASRDSREDKYHSFFRFYIYSVADTFMKELDKFTRLLERVRDWGVRGGQRG